MTPKQLGKWRGTLEKLRADTLAEGPQKIEPNRKDASSVGMADEDEQALSEMLQTLASQRNRKQAELIKQIDRALRKLADLIGLDTVLSIAEVLHRELGDDKYRPCPLLRQYVAAGWLGKKVLRGFYEYDAQGQKKGS